MPFFDEDGQRVLVVYPDIEAEGDDRTEARADLAEMAGALLTLLVADGSVKGAGRRTLLVAHMAGRAGCQSDAELAGRLNLTKSRVSQLRAEIEALLPGFGLCNRRQI